MTAQLAPVPVFKAFDGLGQPLAFGLLGTFQAGTNIPQATYIDSTQTTQNTNPIHLNFRGECALWLDPSLIYKFTLNDALGNNIPGYPVDNIPGGIGAGGLVVSGNIIPSITNTFTLGNSTHTWANVYLGPNGAPALDAVSGNIGYYARTAAEIAVSVTPANFSYPPGDVRRYATSALGVTAAVDTAAVLAVFNVCIKSLQTGFQSCRGNIVAGIYKINEGVLVFDNAFVMTGFPFIDTADDFGTIFMGQNFADAPMITLSNGTATSGAGQYWRAGRLGGIYFKTLRTTGTNSHGLSLRGCQDMHFGQMRGDALLGSTIYIPHFYFGGTDPDPYAVQLCLFEGIEANFGTFFCLDNENDVGFNVNEITYVNGQLTSQGGVKGGGDSNLYITMAFGLCQGWAYDDGIAGLSSNRNRILSAEIDGCQNGLRTNSSFLCTYTGLRFIHRFQLAPNTSPVYWPLTSIDLTAGTNPGLRSLLIKAMHRIETGGSSKSQLGIFCDFHASGATNSDVEIWQDYLDQGTGFSYVNTDFYSNVGGSNHGVVFLSGVRIMEARLSSLAMYTVPSLPSILNTGFNTAANVVSFPTKIIDDNSNFQSSKFYVAPFSGRAHFVIHIPMTLAIGTQVRMALMELIAGVYSSTLLWNNSFAITATVQGYLLTGYATVIQGRQYCLSMDQGTGAPVNASNPSGNPAADIYFHAEMDGAP